MVMIQSLWWPIYMTIVMLCRVLNSELKAKERKQYLDLLLVVSENSKADKDDKELAMEIYNEQAQNIS